MKTIKSIKLVQKGIVLDKKECHIMENIEDCKVSLLSYFT